MNVRSMVAVLSVGAAVGLTQAVCADFVGQPILGVLSNGSVVSGSTAGAADDNDGFDSGIHIFDIWDGGDDVYQIDWLGGDLTVFLETTGAGADNDLFVYSPGALDSTGDYSIVGAFDMVTIQGAAAGIYYINVDSTFFSEGGYTLSVVPAPAVAAFLGLGLVGFAGRRRR